MVFRIRIICTEIKMYLMPLWITGLSFVISATVGRFLGRSGALFVSITSIILSCISACVIFYEICICQTICYIKYMNWIHVDILDIHWGFVYDPLSASMLLVITVVSLCANIYSVEYMRSDPHNIRFFSYLSLFTFFMILLVTSDNALQLFVG
jgi:NADH-ubiquinone oxidoreductase chain 5